MDLAVKQEAEERMELSDDDGLSESADAHLTLPPSKQEHRGLKRPKKDLATAQPQIYKELGGLVDSIIADRDELASEAKERKTVQAECDTIITSLVDKLRAAGLKRTL